MMLPACDFVTVIACVLIHSTNCLTRKEIFRDDFNAKTIDKSKWNLVNAASTVNGELQYYVPGDVQQKTGKLYLRSEKKSHGNKQYTSGRVDTRNKFSFKYGEVEWRARLPKGKGIWPGLWLLRTECPAAVSCPSSFWPPEIDVMEARGDQPNKITTTLHYGVYPHNTYDTKDVIGPDYTAGFHNYKVIWDPNQVTFYVDGEEVFMVTDKKKIPTASLYLIMNVAVGGAYPGNPDSATRFPTEFVIDWVTVHRWE